VTTALDGLLVAEAGGRIAAGVCGSLLAQLGATVVLVGTVTLGTLSLLVTAATAIGAASTPGYLPHAVAAGLVTAAPQFGKARQWPPSLHPLPFG
jgi:hypothetical protein